MHRPALILLSLSLLALAACSEQAPLGPAVDSGPHQASLDHDGVVLTISTPSARFADEDLIPITFRVLNDGGKAVTYDFNSTKQHDIQVSADDTRVWAWSHGRGFGRALTSFTLNPGESREWTEFWDQLDNDGQAVDAGTYEIVGVLPARTPLRSAPLEITIR